MKLVRRRLTKKTRVGAPAPPPPPQPSGTVTGSHGGSGGPADGDDADEDDDGHSNWSRDHRQQPQQHLASIDWNGTAHK